MAEDAKNQDTLSEDAKPLHKRLGGIPITVLETLMIVLVILASIAFLQGVRTIDNAYSELESASYVYLECEAAANDLREASYDLTKEVRAYVVTQNPVYLEEYFTEILVEQRREQAISTLRKYSRTDDTTGYLELAMQNSKRLAEIEHYAIALVASAKGHDLAPYASALDGISLSEADAALSGDEKIDLAISMCFSSEYERMHNAVMSNADSCRDALIQNLGNVQVNGAQTMHDQLFNQRVITWVLLALVLLLVLSFVFLVLLPLRNNILKVQQNEELPLSGATELRALAKAYNVMYEETMKNHDSLRRRAEHDHLTNLYNRSVFERLLQVYSDEPFALLLIDADHFKDINDTLGHDGGDAMLRKIAGLLSHTFRATDYPCRIGGDEFAVIMTEMNEELSSVVEAKIGNVTSGLRDTSDGLPVMTLSIGIAFNDGTLDAETIFKHADDALYGVKEAGRNGFAFYSPDKTAANAS